ncbi:hypothetical protein N431DRAFT_181368 [Stipitochalara longipes BDJ]|nr:hypothetical protein N431DRAFT_181368 [Stipitochalara longipes BDJ]
MTPRLPSPQPGSNLSTLTSPSFRTAHSTLSQNPLSPSRSPSLAPTKNFSFLIRPEIYHPLTLLDVPPPFRVASLQPDPSTPLPSLVALGNFRSAAIKAAQLLTSPDLSPSLPADISTIFSLIYTRLSCLTLCGQTALAAQEVKALEDLNSSYYRDDEGRHLVSWELRVLAVRLQGMGFNDARRGVMGYYELGREARLNLTSLKKSRTSTLTVGSDGDEEKRDVDEALEAEIQIWETRLQELGVRVASALVEMDDLEGAARFLATLSPSTPSSISALDVQKALLYLCLGDVEAARSCISASTSGSESSAAEAKVILALAHMADSDFSSAVTIWEELIASSTSSPSQISEEPMYRQNLGVCLLYLGRMSEAREILEQLVETQNAFHALTFNLSTIYELCTERSRVLKIGLAEKVAGMQNEGRGGEKGNGDFKL